MPPGPRPPREEDSDYNNGTRTDQSRRGKKPIPFVPVNKKTGRQAQNVQAAARRRLDGATSRVSNPNMREMHKIDRGVSPDDSPYDVWSKSGKPKGKKESPNIAAAASRALSRKAV